MAELWKRNIEGNLYEVRSAGATLRLYRNGVHHSQYNPNRPLGGCIWDLLALPALFRPEQVRSALILGFGAGAAGRLLRELVAPDQVVGVELDEIHLSIADGFECSEGCELVAGDAVEWVQDGAEGGRFDFILDDLYGEEGDGMPVRYAPLDLDWCRHLAELVNPGGMLVFNLIEPEKIPHLPLMTDPVLRKRFPFVHMTRMEGFENRVVTFSEQALDLAVFDTNLKAFCRQHPRCYGVSKRYLHEQL